MIVAVLSAVTVLSEVVPFSIVAPLYSSFIRDIFNCALESAEDRKALSSLSVPVTASTNTLLSDSNPVIIKSF